MALLHKLGLVLIQINKFTSVLIDLVSTPVLQIT